MDGCVGVLGDKGVTFDVPYARLAFYVLCGKRTTVPRRMQRAIIIPN